MDNKKYGVRHTEEFKRDAVDHWIHSRKSARQVARDLGIAESTLRRWKTRSSGEDERPREENLAAENERLRKDILELRQEREILKKSVAIFLKPQR